jgi:hypothetical protein
MSDEDELSPEEILELQKALQGVPQAEEKTHIIAFLKEILRTSDTTKVSNLDKEEVASVRILQDTAQYCRAMGLKDVENYINKKAEIVLATADSKEGFLPKLAVTSQKSIGINRNRRTIRKGGWFGKKEEVSEDESGTT